MAVEPDLVLEAVTDLTRRRVISSRDVERYLREVVPTAPTDDVVAALDALVEANKLERVPAGARAFEGGDETPIPDGYRLL